MRLSPTEITMFLLVIASMLFFARSFGEAVRLIKQPIIVGEILAGIILGPTILGTLLPDLFAALFQSSGNIMIAMEGITTLAVIMLLLVSGLEVDLSIIVRLGKISALTSIMGIIFPFSIGFAAAYFFPEYLGIGDLNQKLIFALFVGTALSITALPVVARTLMDLNIFKSEIGFIVISSAMLDDLTGWIIFSIILTMVGANHENISMGSMIGIVFIFVLVILILGRKIISRIIPFIQNKITFPGGILNFILILGFLSAAFTEYIGIHAIFGAFIMGVAIGDSAALKENTREIIQQFVTNIFAPLFFVSIGLRVNFIEYFDLSLVLIFLVLAFAGKVIGCGFGARLGGLNRNDAIAVGFGMNSRGAMEIVLGILALQYGLIEEKVFVALVIMALFTSISSAPFMSYFLKDRRKFDLKQLITLKSIIFSDAETKQDVIKELSELISNQNNLDGRFIFQEVLKRENLLASGISNYLAIPHAKIDIKQPYIGVTLHKDGIDFEAIDKLPGKIIFLLLTPKTNNELQLKLLTEIAHAFQDKTLVEDLIKSRTEVEFHSKLIRNVTISSK